MSQIKNWKTNEVIFEYKGTLKDAVEEAIRQDISLASADLNYADLSDADLERAYLYNAKLIGANLSCADLDGANLNAANLYRANLYNANLRYANLFANLRGVDLRGADLRGANLEGADFSDADLNGANFEGATLYNADLRLAKNIPDDIMPLACPAEGSFIAWKKVKGKLVKLEIPEDAKRSSATTKKCRCSKAKVLAITNLDETESFDEVYNWNYAPLTYKVGEIVYPDSFDEYRWNECSHGIHFFMSKEDALNW